MIVQPASLEDILVVGWLQEGPQYRQFQPNQVFSSNAVDRLRGRRFRRAFFTQSATALPRSGRFFEYLHQVASRYGGEVRPIEDYDQCMLADEVDRYLREQLDLLDGGV
ncbi:hypothetical protein M2302_002269 [Micromonospora sp. A200]|uniref:hypothetical protein n=1 Tax=Micromonospora sp. A200 TaxID=2940568 RepID=UPI0024741873|nr:hypothetical protein [Micromonospora sp. A200]MDH6462094.1 hypothetical protein [Micromonospora sp. A200]